ncbi:hypothetical protein M427DRAFT_162599 [Gonapodya prolifera JEL478]|uniref:Uncharacterized protein n=1 Tax=Gonapodya prolifera (strain JEL478) TaxID=1344416 RepID=A0A139AZ62_GONPJ|nr:hypothetical protein M427DRAFT_162599 [Gonapodya prolifera JEL478]|eukprot:KXS22038.1 hypothetical protein M427DRAFT_162599 [Gonapodya prolifera JEL478]
MGRERKTIWKGSSMRLVHRDEKGHRMPYLSKRWLMWLTISLAFCVLRVAGSETFQNCHPAISKGKPFHHFKNEAQVLHKRRTQPCLGELVDCGAWCMPKGGRCCSAGSWWCPSDATCTASGCSGCNSTCDGRCKTTASLLVSFLDCGKCGNQCVDPVNGAGYCSEGVCKYGELSVLSQIALGNVIFTICNHCSLR